MGFRSCLATALAIGLTASSASAAIVSIGSMTNPSVQLDFEGMSTGPTTVTDINSFYPGADFVDITFNAPLAGDGLYNVVTVLGRALALQSGGSGNLAIVDPGSTFGGGNGYRFDLSGPMTQVGLSIGDWFGSKTVSFYSGGGVVGASTVSTSTVGAVQFYEIDSGDFDRVDVTGAPNFVIPEIWVEQSSTGGGGGGTVPVVPASSTGGAIVLIVLLAGLFLVVLRPGAATAS